MMVRTKFDALAAEDFDAGLGETFDLGILLLYHRYQFLWVKKCYELVLWWWRWGL